MLAHSQSDFVFHRKDGSRWTNIHDSFDRLVKRCELQAEPPFNITLHTLRHTFGSWLAIAGVPLRAIQKLMGHNSIVTTERYAHLSGESLTSAVQKIETLLPNSLPSGPEPAQTDVPLVHVTPTKNWCGGRESNPHVPYGTRDFKSRASTSSATPALSPACPALRAIPLSMLVSITIEAGRNKTLLFEDYGIYRQRLLQRHFRTGWPWNDEVRVPGTVEVRAQSRLERVPIPCVKPRIDNRLIP